MPKLVQKDGYRVIENTGWENFSGFLGGLLQGLQQQQLLQQKNQSEARALQQSQAQMRVALAQIADNNPEIYNELIADPGIQEFMDPAKVERLQRLGESPFEKFKRDRAMKKVDQASTATGPNALGTPPSGPGASPTYPTGPGFGVSVPGGGGLTTPPSSGTGRMQQASPDAIAAFKAERAAKVAKAGADVAQSGAAIDMAKFTSLAAAYRSKKLTSEQFADQILGLTGSPASISDIAVGSGKVTPEVAAANIPGTIEYRKQQVLQLTADLAKEYQITDATSMDQVKALAEYQLGLREDMPQLPTRYKDLEQKMGERAMALREKEFAFDREKFELSTRANISGTAMNLVQAGVDPNAAFKAADTFIRTGSLPDVQLTPDRKAALEAQLMQIRLDQAKLELERARVDDPQVNNLIRMIQLIPQDERESNEYYKRLQKIMADKYGWTFASKTPGWWGFIIDAISAVVQYPEQTITGIDPMSGAIRSGLSIGRDAIQAYQNRNTGGKPPGIQGTPAIHSTSQFDETSGHGAAGVTAPPASAVKPLASPQFEAAGIQTVTQAIQAYQNLAAGKDKTALYDKLQELQTARAEQDIKGQARIINEINQILTVLKVK